MSYRVSIDGLSDWFVNAYADFLRINGTDVAVGTYFSAIDLFAIENGFRIEYKDRVIHSAVFENQSAATMFMLRWA